MTSRVHLLKRVKLWDKIAKAREKLEESAITKTEKENVDYEDKVEVKTGGFPPKDTRDPGEQMNLTMPATVTNWLSMCRESGHNHRKHDRRPLVIGKKAPADFFRRRGWVRKMMTTMTTDRVKIFPGHERRRWNPCLDSSSKGLRQFL